MHQPERVGRVIANWVLQCQVLLYPNLQQLRTTLWKRLFFNLHLLIILENVGADNPCFTDNHLSMRWLIEREPMWALCKHLGLF